MKKIKTLYFQNVQPETPKDYDLWIKEYHPEMCKPQYLLYIYSIDSKKWLYLIDFNSMDYFLNILYGVEPKYSFCFFDYTQAKENQIGKINLNEKDK